MKIFKFRYTYVLFLLFVSAIIVSCDNDDDDDPEPNNNTAKFGKVDVSFNYKLGNDDFSTSSKFTTVRGDSVIIRDGVRFFVSNATLVKTDGSELELDDNGFYLGTEGTVNNDNSFTLDSIPNGEYNELRFFVGVPKPQNYDNTVPNLGEIDPTIPGMVWSWATGYIFFRVDAELYVNDSSQFLSTPYHVGEPDSIGFDNYRQISVPLASNLTINGDNKTLSIDLDFVKLWGTDSSNTVQSIQERGNKGIKAISHADTMAVAFQEMFSFDAIQ